MKRHLNAFSRAALNATLACCGLVACGDLGEVEHRAPLAAIDGQLSQASASASLEPVTNVRVAVLWSTSNDGYKSTYDLPATPVFPSKFRIELKDAPPVKAMVSYPTGSGTSFALAIGSIVAYEDRNGNGQLDLVATGESPVDRVLGANEKLALVYVEGNYVSPFNAEFSGAPVKGYNLLRGSDCEPRKARAGEAAPPPCEAPAWIPITTLYDLPLTAEPKFAEMMCRNNSGTTTASPTKQSTKPGETPPAAPGPNGWPAKDEPGLLCAKDGKSYMVTRCETTWLGLCQGQHQSCTEDTWGLPSTPPPAEWPCSSN